MKILYFCLYLGKVVKKMLFFCCGADIEYLRSIMPESVEPEFFTYLQSLTAKDVTLYAVDEGSVVFPRSVFFIGYENFDSSVYNVGIRVICRVPMIRTEGPLIIVQLLETTLLTLVNYASLMATNASRYRMVAGKHVSLLEFGLRRAQGPDGGLSASRYSYIGQ